MSYLLLFIVATVLFAFIFTGVTYFLGLFSEHFKISNASGLKEVFTKFLIIAAVYVLLCIFGIGGLLGLIAMTFIYKTVFGAGWLQALVIGVVGGVIGWTLFVYLLAVFIEVAETAA